MNIYTVKWGDKYNHQHVNNVYDACKQFYGEDFDFFCLTENPKGLDKNITPLALPGGNKLVKWWNKNAGDIFEERGRAHRPGRGGRDDAVGRHRQERPPARQRL